MGTSYSAIAIANYFVDCSKGKSDLTPMKMQKLIFIAHGWYLAYFDEPLIEDEIQPWEWGPVIPIVYDSFRSFGNRPITKKGTNFEFDWDYFSELKKPEVDKDDEQVKLFLKQVWEAYAKYSASQLSKSTHKKGTPWDKANSEKSSVIENEWIKKYYKGLKR